MGKPQTINGLMKHLRDCCNVNIKGSYQKKQLISYGYYHGYKGYRFAKNSQNRLAYSEFSEVVAVIEYDNQLKAALYMPLMFLETAIKNVVCNSALQGLKNETFEAVYRDCMGDRPTDAKLRSKRLRLRNSIYSHLSARYEKEKNMSNQMVRHFYDKGDDVPLWAVFETMYVSDLAMFFECLDGAVRDSILRSLNMRDVAIDTKGQLLSDILYTLKALRNAVAHNNVVFDARFQDRKISTVLQKWIEKETGIKNVSLSSLLDYIIVICGLLTRTDFTGERRNKLLDAYLLETKLLRNRVTGTIYNQIIPRNVTGKVTQLQNYLKKMN